MSQVLANSVSLLIESLSFPDGVKITSPSNSYVRCYVTILCDDSLTSF